jgi:hypothetical protein
MKRKIGIIGCSIVLIGLVCLRLCSAGENIDHSALDRNYSYELTDSAKVNRIRNGGVFFLSPPKKKEAYSQWKGLSVRDTFYKVKPPVSSFSIFTAAEKMAQSVTHRNLFFYALNAGVVSNPRAGNSIQSGPIVAPDKSVAGHKAGFGKWWTLSGYSDSGYRKTQFYAPDYDTWVFLGDGRLELWLPPNYSRFSWGLYLRGAIIASTRSESSFENMWLAAPGGGLQIYPFSGSKFIKKHDTLAQVFGPVRFYAEYNRQYCWCDINNSVPKSQIRGGIEYWKAINVNTIERAVWGEIWNGLIYQTANDFNKDYNSLVFGNSMRVGVRKPGKSILSWLSAYAVIDSSLTEHEDYYWENRLRAGGGIRIAPPISEDIKPIMNRLVFYAEYLRNTKYYRSSPSSSIPDYDLRAGISISFGEWIRNPNKGRMIQNPLSEIKAKTGE